MACYFWGKRFRLRIRKGDTRGGEGGGDAVCGRLWFMFVRDRYLGSELLEFDTDV